MVKCHCPQRVYLSHLLNYHNHNVMYNFHFISDEEDVKVLVDKRVWKYTSATL